MKRNQDLEDDNIDPLKGPKGDTAFLRSNYKFMAPGGSFRTVKAWFSPAQIQAEASKAGWAVDVREEGLWLRVTVTKRLPMEKVTKNPGLYAGAGKAYPGGQR